MEGRIVLGIDEAGRGAVLGPLVVGGFALPEERVPELAAAGVRDSKALAPARRAEVYERLERLGELASIDIEPPVIDRSVRRGELNRLEAEAFARLVRKLHPAVSYVDACDVNAERFGRTVGSLSGGTRVIARHKADRDLPVVGAASIVAKVRRDRAVAELGRKLGAAIGSGYPSDAATITFLRSRLPVRGEPPPWLRASWATTMRMTAQSTVRPLEGFGP